MNIKTTLILMVLLLSFGLYYFFVELNNQTSSQRIEEEKKTEYYLFDQKSRNVEQVNRVAITLNAKTDLYENKGGKWSQIQPAAYPLSSFGLIDQLLDERVIGVIAEGDPSYKSIDKDFFDEPFGHVAIFYQDGSIESLILGKQMPGGKAYVMLGNKKGFYQISDFVYGSVASEYIQANYFQKKMVLPKLDLLDELEIKTADRDLEILKDQKLQWRVKDEPLMPVYGAKLQGLVSQFAKQADRGLSDFVSVSTKDLGLYHLDKPKMKIGFKRGDQTLTLQIGRGVVSDETGRLYYACWQPSVDAEQVVCFVLDAGLLKESAVILKHIRDTRVVTYAPKHLVKISLSTIDERGDDSIKVWLEKREAGGWSIATPNLKEQRVKAQDVSDFLNPLYKSQATNHQAVTESMRKTHRLKLYSELQLEPEVFDLLKEGERYYLHRQGQLGCVEIKPSLATHLLTLGSTTGKK